MIIRKLLPGLGSAIVLPLLIAACGSGDSVVNSSMPSDLSGANNTAEPVVMQDTFVDAVTAAVATTSEVDDPVPIDSVTATGPDNTAPVPIV